jgi:hypothetical protein
MDGQKCLPECSLHLFLSCTFSWYILELSVKYPKLGIPGQTGDGIKSQDENSTQEKTEGTKLVFSPKIDPQPQFWICLTSTLTAAHILP